MFKFTFLSAVLVLAVSGNSYACECLGRSKPCERLQSDAVFVGRVLETRPVKHPVDKNSWTYGYSMQFAVEESLRGGVGTEVSIQTGGGGGDCGTPLKPGERFLIFAYKEKDGALWTGMCSGNRLLDGNPDGEKQIEVLRSLVKQGGGRIFGRVSRIKPVWNGDDVGNGVEERAVPGILMHAKSDTFAETFITNKDGTYDFTGLPHGKYKVAPDLPPGWDFDHEYEENYEAEVSKGGCAHINFVLQPDTRIKGHVTFPPGVKPTSVEVVAVPRQLKELNQFSGKWDFTEDGRFDLWPLPPGDYFVGVNINSSPKEGAPFPPTYYPGVTSKRAASVVHLDEGEVKHLELHLPEVAKPRLVNFVAIGLDGKPLRTIYIQREDLRHAGDAASYVNVDLNEHGVGTMIIYAGYSYHLHGSHFVKSGEDWCAKPVPISAGTQPVQVRFVMDHKAADCDLQEIDRLRK